MRLQNLIKKLLKIIDKMVTKNGLASAFIFLWHIPPGIKTVNICSCTLWHLCQCIENIQIIPCPHTYTAGTKSAKYFPPGIYHKQYVRDKPKHNIWQQTHKNESFLCHILRPCYKQKSIFQICVQIHFIFKTQTVKYFVGKQRQIG